MNASDIFSWIFVIVIIAAFSFFIYGAVKDDYKEKKFCEFYGGTIYRGDCFIINETEGIIINCEIIEPNKELLLLCEKREFYP